jgi:ppGpp synthetase/RelA/SpoT-type nucleotidyltranferase
VDTQQSPFCITSKGQLDKAGEVLRGDRMVPAFETAYDVLAVYRQLFSKPMQLVNNRARQIIQKYLPELKPQHYIIAQRHKTLYSTILKLDRFKARLSQIQDIGGVRVILPDVDSVKRFCKFFPGQSKTVRLLPDKTKNYISTPKDDGYRGIHLLLELDNKKPELANISTVVVELQVRTNLQHYWATAVEVAGVMNQKGYKTGDWDEDWKQFFTQVAYLFACRDEPTNDSVASQLDCAKRAYALATKLDLWKKLGVARLMGKWLIANPKQKGFSHVVLIMIPHTKKFSVLTPDNKEDEASFKEHELRFLNTKNGELMVSVGLDNFKQLQKAYPNFAMDTTQFLEVLQSILNSTLQP